MFGHGIYFCMNTHPEKPVIPSLMFPPTFLEYKPKLIKDIVFNVYQIIIYYIYYSVTNLNNFF